ncbi:MAG: hypothetical protein ABIV63_18425 [Caldimonas sp.]
MNDETREPGSEDPKAVDARVDEIVRCGPSGAFAVAGVATAIVMALYIAFYFFVYLPRGVMQ